MTTACGRRRCGPTTGAWDSEAQSCRVSGPVAGSMGARRVVLSSTAALGRLVYFFMGAGPEHTARMPGSIPKAEQPIPMRELFGEVARAGQPFWRSCKVWASQAARSDRCSGLLVAERRPSTRRSASSFAGGCSCRCRRASIGGWSCARTPFPYKLHVVADQTATATEKSTAIGEFLQAAGCCLGWYDRRLRTLFGTTALSGPWARRVIGTWLRTMLSSSYAAEREHA